MKKYSSTLSFNYRADILITAQKKKECEVHAMKIVQLLIEGQMQPQVFLNCVS